MWMQAFLQHTEHRHRDVSNELIRVWLKKSYDATFDAQNAFDHYFLMIDLSRYPTWTQSIIRFLAGLTTQLSVRHDLSRRIAEINSRLEDIIINKETYKVETEPDKSAVLWKTSKNISTIATNLENVRPNLIPQGKLVWNLENNHRSLRYVLEESGVGKTTLVRDMYESEITKTSFDVKVIHRSVIYVIGKSGLGKTTLVRDMYESEITKTSFDVKVWQKFPALMDSSTILQLINQQLDGLKKKTQQLDGGGILSSRKGIDKVVCRQLTEIKGKFLVVIDGELRDSDWNTIRSTLLPDKSNGSRVIRIVHSKDKPKNTDDDEIIRVEPFKCDAAIKLFNEMVQNKHFKDEEPSKRLSDNSTNTAERGENEGQNDPKTSIYASMWTITSGLPLAVMLLSGLLKTREYPNEWEAVLKHLMSKQSKRLGSLLTTCFDDLPQELKPCFLYFAAFPVKTSIEARKLVRLWMAEGFLRPRDGNTMESVGRIYLNELNSRHLVQLVKDDISGDEELVSIHHKVHQFVQLEAQEANFVDIHNGYDMPYSTSARRLSLQNYTNKYAALANSMPKLRSVFSNFIREDEKDTGALNGNGEEQNIEVDGKEDDEIDNVTDGLRKLKDPDEGDKSIKQQGKQNEISEQEQSKKPWIGPWPALLNYWGNGKKRQEYIKISEMLQVSKFLRVVKLQGIEFGENLPATIGNAVHLQYLGVTGCSLKWIPPAVGKLKHLQTLDVQDTKVDELPQAFWQIRTLRHVLGTSIYLPKRVGNLKHLQTLAKVHPDPNHNYWDPKTFERMLRLKSLNIKSSSEDAQNMKILFDAIAEPNILEYLETLVLHATTKLPMCIFTSSSQRRLRALELYGKLEWDVRMLSSEKGKEETNICLPNLTTLSLEGTLVTQDFMDYLANFPLLANLTLKQNFYKNTKLVFNSGGYKCLAKMTLCDLGNLEVEIMESALPVLTDLVIQNTQTQAKRVVHGKHECLKTLQNEKN